MNPHTKRTNTSSSGAKGAIVRYGVGVKKYEILEHTADLKIKVFGKTKEELFLNALLGMGSGLRPKIKNALVRPADGFRKKSPGRLLSQTAGQAKIKKIKVKSSNLETLLADFLNEVLYQIQVNKETYDEVKFINFSDTELEAKLMGQKVESFGEDIKAATYHGLDIRQKEDGVWEAVILFDI